MTSLQRRMESLHLALYLEAVKRDKIHETVSQFAAFIGDGELAEIRLGCLKAAIRERSSSMTSSKAMQIADEFFAMVNPPPPPKPFGRQTRSRKSQGRSGRTTS
jgi:hypothetical protein